MTPEDLLDLRSALRDLRFIQAASVVSTGQQDTKPIKAYMAKLTRLDEVLEQEYNKERVLNDVRS